MSSGQLASADSSNNSEIAAGGASVASNPTTTAEHEGQARAQNSSPRVSTTSPQLPPLEQHHRSLSFSVENILAPGRFGNQNPLAGLRLNRHFEEGKINWSNFGYG